MDWPWTTYDEAIQMDIPERSTLSYIVFTFIKTMKSMLYLINMNERSDSMLVIHNNDS